MSRQGSAAMSCGLSVPHSVWVHVVFNEIVFMPTQWPGFVAFSSAFFGTAEAGV